MRRETINTIKRHTIWLSLLGHLLLLMTFTTVMILTAKPDLPSTAPQSSVPSYLAPSPEAPPAPAQEAKPEPKAEPAPQPKPEPKPEPKETAKDGIEKPVSKQAQQSKPKTKASTKFDPSTVKFSPSAVPEDVTDPRDNEPLHLVGENKIVKPLIKILARALSKHLTYPRVAADFNLRGVVAVGFVIHPEGYVTGARIVQSSGAGVLDDEARDAVAAMGPVGDVSEYVPEPQFLVVGVIFG